MRAHWVEVITGTGTPSTAGSPLAGMNTSSQRAGGDTVAQFFDKPHN